VGLEKVVARRTGKKSMGFLQEEEKSSGRSSSSVMSGRRDIDLLSQAQPMDSGSRRCESRTQRSKCSDSRPMSPG